MVLLFISSNTDKIVAFFLKKEFDCCEVVRYEQKVGRQNLPGQKCEFNSTSHNCPVSRLKGAVMMKDEKENLLSFSYVI